jgi:hypothetical protein
MTDKIKDELEKEIEDKRELIHSMEIAGYEDNQSQIIFRKTKKQIANLKAKLSQHLATKKEMIEKFEKMIDGWSKILDKRYYKKYAKDRHRDIKELKQKLGELK